MPIYEYRCKQCDAKFEKRVKLSTQAAEIECPKCGARRVEKAVSLFGTASSPLSGGPSHAAACGPVS